MAWLSLVQFFTYGLITEKRSPDVDLLSIGPLGKLNEFQNQMTIFSLGHWTHLNILSLRTGNFVEVSS